MTLHPLVAALGGELYAGGCRANVPAPGHSAADRSVSLMLNEGRVIIHGFGGADWRAVRDDLRRRGFIDDAGRLTGRGSAGPSAPRPDRRVRLETAAELWRGGVTLHDATPSARHLRRRAVEAGAQALNLLHHPNAPVSVYRRAGRACPALMARVSDSADQLTAIELTYLDASGRLASGLALRRKTVGLVPPGAAVRLARAAEAMLVGEGVVTTLSAMQRFRLPGWALMAAHNLAAWTPPPGVRQVLIAADRGEVGQDAADRLHRRLLRMGVDGVVVWPAAPFGDWNEVEVEAALQRGKQGGREAPERRG